MMHAERGAECHRRVRVGAVGRCHRRQVCHKQTLSSLGRCVGATTECHWQVLRITGRQKSSRSNFQLPAGFPITLLVASWQRMLEIVITSHSLTANWALSSYTIAGPWRCCDSQISLLFCIIIQYL